MNFSGYSVKREVALPELSGVLYQLVHDKTGLEVVWLKRDEENKTFGIAFETLPWDDTGVFHILEHSVLCGSDKYPVKEPFVELMKSSMNTFLNALTFQDKTFYPISSRNDKDFINLTRVYLDAVFRPLIYSKPEIFMQEGWHYELDGEDNASYKGVVFNEMKGVFSSAEELEVNALNRLLFPESPYRFVSGGDPASIPDLSYEEFVNSHRRFYSPSNAYVFVDGCVDIEEVLGILEEYIGDCEKTERLAPPAMQKAVSGEFEGEYELSAEEPLEGKTRLCFGKVVGTFEEREKIVAASVLAETLCGSNHSELSKAILGEGLAEDVSMSLNDGILQPWLLLEIKNIKDGDLEKVQALVCARLEQLATDGLDREKLEAVMANVEFKLRERDYGTYPQGIIFGFSVLESWLYGGDPSLNLQVGDLFEELKKKMNEGYFENLIRELLLDNPHSAKVVLRPSYSFGEERRAAENARLEKETSAWSKADLNAAKEAQEKLLSWQDSVDSPEVLATIPQLSIEDIPPTVNNIPTEISDVSGITVLKHDLPTAGIAYINLYFDADFCSEEDLSLLSFICCLLGETDTEKRSAEETVNATRLYCGDVSFAPVDYVVDNDPNNVKTKFRVSFSALGSKLDQAFDVIAEILTQSRFGEDASHDLLRQVTMSVFQSAVMSGNSVGLTRVFAQMSPAGVIEDCVGGINFYRWLKNTDENWDFESLNARMNALLTSIVNRNGLTVGVSGVKDTEKFVKRVAETFPERNILPKAEILPWGKKKEGIVIPSDISFAVLGGNYSDFCNYSGELGVATQVATLCYLWNVVRVQGGAYGVGMKMLQTGLLGFYSYRDPSGNESLAKYRDTAEFLRDFAENETDLTGFIIGASTAALLMPKSKASVADARFFSNVTDEKRLEIHKQLLSTKPEDLLKVADVVEKVLDDCGVCMVGGKEQIDACKELEDIIVL